MSQWAARAHLFGNTRRIDFTFADAWHCDDPGNPDNGKAFPGIQHVSWDATTLTGQVVVAHTTAACEYAAGENGNTHSFSLTKI
jgi:hypothetical protein